MDAVILGGQHGHGRAAQKVLRKRGTERTIGGQNGDVLARKNSLSLQGKVCNRKTGVLKGHLLNAQFTRTVCTRPWFKTRPSAQTKMEKGSQGVFASQIDLAYQMHNAK